LLKNLSAKIRNKKSCTFATRLKNGKMTQIILENSIDNMQMSVLMGLFDSWNVNVKITNKKVSENKNFTQRFARTRGIWKDYDIDAKQLRRDAWGTEKLIHQ
jgi:hypothetical protein